MSNVVRVARCAPVQPARGRWIPWIFVAGFAVIVAVNGVMIAYALKTFPGLADPAAYNHGVAYNAVLAEADRQEALGWRLAARLEPHGDISASDIVVRATRPDGTPLDGLTVIGQLTRPIDTPATVDAALEPAGQGIYRTRVALPRAGQWELHITAVAGADRLDLRQRVIAQ
jgi:nitrogen fixation protein FixH